MTHAQARARHAELAEEIRHHDQLYYVEARPIITDQQYDRLYRELLDLEIQGATPAALRRHLRLRAALTTAAGLVGGVALGAILSILVVDFVALTANAAVPQPPLQLYIDWRVLGIGAVVYLVVTTLVILAVTWLPFRDVRGRVAPEAA